MFVKWLLTYIFVDWLMRCFVLHKIFLRQVVTQLNTWRFHKAEDRYEITNGHYVNCYIVKEHNCFLFSHKILKWDSKCKSEIRNNIFPTKSAPFDYKTISNVIDNAVSVWLHSFYHFHNIIAHSIFIYIGKFIDWNLV